MPWTLSRREFTHRSLASAATTALILIGCAPTAPSPPVQLASSGEVVSEPDPAAAFLRAFERGDETTAEELASPLYEKEWTRRKVTVGNRLAWLPATFRKGQAGDTWLD